MQAQSSASKPRFQNGVVTADAEPCDQDTCVLVANGLGRLSMPRRNSASPAGSVNSLPARTTRPPTECSSTFLQGLNTPSPLILTSSSATLTVHVRPSFATKATIEGVMEGALLGLI